MRSHFVGFAFRAVSRRPQWVPASLIALGSSIAATGPTGHLQVCVCEGVLVGLRIPVFEQLSLSGDTIV